MKYKEFESVLECLPRVAADAVRSVWQSGKWEKLNEIHLRACGYQSLTFGNENLIISKDGKYARNVSEPLKISSFELEETVLKLCGGAVYSRADEISKGFISVNGIRVGICGTGVINGGIPTGFSAYTSVNIRVPHHVKNAADSLLKLVETRGNAYVGGVLVISPPGMGKTTFLRSYAAALSSGFYNGGAFCTARVAIADERGELFIPHVFCDGICDVVSFFPKAYAAELLTRSMAPEYIICDEISPSDTEKLIDVASKGVIFAASCHGVSFEDALSKNGVRSLFEKGVFSTVCELYSGRGERRCTIRRPCDVGALREKVPC
ncbi:MAG: hypothetical protein IKV97_07220 [Clostridia bacterium]|nr:hypothetical protein [Clostridia bacterium]